MAESDLFMAIHVGTQGIFGVIDMKAFETVQPDHPLKRAKEILITLSGDNIVAASQNMAGIQADPHFFGVAA